MAVRATGRPFGGSFDDEMNEWATLLAVWCYSRKRQQPRAQHTATTVLKTTQQQLLFNNADSRRKKTCSSILCFSLSLDSFQKFGVSQSDLPSGAFSSELPRSGNTSPQAQAFQLIFPLHSEACYSANGRWRRRKRKLLQHCFRTAHSRVFHSTEQQPLST